MHSWKETFKETIIGMIYTFLVVVPLLTVGFCFTLKLGQYLYKLFGL
jgi:hypothetical protein